MNSTEHQCTCRITIQSPRNLSPIVVWGFYAAVFLGILTSITIIFAKQNNSKKSNIQAQLLNSIFKDDGSPKISLDSLIFYESLLHRKSKNISWIDGSNDEIYYKIPNLDIMVLNATIALEKFQTLSNRRMNFEKTLNQALYFHHAQFKDKNFIISPNKFYIAILWDVQISFTETQKYRVTIKEFNSGIEKKILKKGNFVSYFFFSAKDDLYFYTYNDKGIQKHYKCFLNHSDLNKTREFCQIEFTFNKVRRLGVLNHKEYSIYEGNSDSIIDGILYKENGTILLYPRIKSYTYNRAFPKTSELKDFRSKFRKKMYKIKLNFSENEVKNCTPEMNGHKVVPNFGSVIEGKVANCPSEKNKWSTQKLKKVTNQQGEIIYFGISKRREDQINYSSCREEAEYVSVEYTIHYPDETAIFYGLLGKNNSFYFPSKQKAFFIEPASGIIQLDSKPWVLHPFIFQNKTSGINTFNMAISTSSGVDQESKDNHINKSSNNNYLPLLTSDYFVTQILKVRKDERTRDIFAYFIATPTRNASRRNFYKIKIVYPHIEKTLIEAVTCLTCPEENSEGGLEKSQIYPQCLWADVEMSSRGDYYLLHCKGPDVPWTVIVNTQTNRIFHNLKENDDIRAWDSSIKKPRIHEFELKLKCGFIGRVKLHFPLEWHPKIEKCPRKYKLLLHVDGTPEGQLVTAKYKVSWFWHLILKKNFIVVEADVRGSGHQSINMSSSIWKNIGILEIEDQISVVEYILKTFKCLDPNQVAVYGEAYGGYTALSVMAMDATNLFKCCAAISPITTWQHYSHDFAIKLFGGEYNNATKTDYERANLATRVNGLKDKNFIIYSATMDQEIPRYHVHNFLQALADKGILFKHHQYIDQRHEISDYRVHLYKHIEQYFTNCFDKKN